MKPSLRILSIFLVAGLMLGLFVQSGLAEDPPPPPELHLSTTELDFGEVELWSEPITMSFTISNSGGEPLFIGPLILGEYPIPDPFPGKNFTFNSNPCNEIYLLPGQSCQVSVDFVARYMGWLEGWVEIRTNGGDNKVTLLGTGLRGYIHPIPDPPSFGDQNIGLISPPKVITIQNDGNYDITFASFTPPPEFEVRNNQCAGQPLPMAATCTLEVVFAPTTIGPKSGKLNIDSDSLSYPDLVPLSGTGINPGVGVTPSALQFGNVAVNTTSLPQKVTITNTGTTQLTFTRFRFTGNFEGGVMGAGDCTAPLLPAASCTFPVVFFPKSGGDLSGKLSIETNARTSPDLVDLSGKGILPPSAVTQPATFVGQTMATLNGVANAGGTTANVYFEYGPTNAYGTLIEIPGGPIAGNNDVAVNLHITGLQINTPYHYRLKVIAHNPTGQAFGVDQVFTTSTTLVDLPPTVVSIKRANPNPSSALFVNFTVTFSEAVSGVDVGDFTLTTNGLPGAAILSVNGAGAVYTVTVRTGAQSGSGTLRLDVPLSASAVDSTGNALAGRPYTGGQTYNVNQARVVYLPLARR